MTGRQLGPNDRQPCGTWARRVWHLAHGQTCTRCGTDRPTPDTYPTDTTKDRVA